MADAYIQIPTDGSGKKLDAESLSVMGQTVYRERDQIVGVNADDIAVVTDSDPAADDHALVVREAPPVNPQVTATSEAAVAAGGSADLSSASVTASKIGKLAQISVSSSVPIKAAIKKVADGIETTVDVLFGWDGQIEYRPPHKDYVKVTGTATAGFDGFRVTVENLGAGSAAADVYAAFYFDLVG